MQNLTECARRHYSVSKKYIRPALKCCTGKPSDSSRTFRSSTCKFWSDRLCAPVSINDSQRFSKDLPVISNLLLKSSLSNSHRTLGPSGLHSVRFLHTTGPLATGGDKKPEQNDNSDKDKKSDKEDPDKKNKTPKEEALPLVIHLVMMGSAAMIVYFVFHSLTDTGTAERMLKVSWNEFVHQMLAKGEVNRIIINADNNIIKIQLQDDAIVHNKRHMYKTMFMMVPDVAKTEEKIRQAEDRLGIAYSQRVPIIYERIPERVKVFVNILLVVAIAMLLRGAMSYSKNFMAEMKKIINPGIAKFTLVEPTTGKGINFSDVAGLKEAKVEVMEFVDYLKHPERYRTLGAKIPKGALLLGPPGCGKTMLAKAVATESNVPFLSMNGCEFIEMYGGLGAARVRDLFKEAKKRAPSIIYIDEIDAFGQVRATNAQASNNETERTLVQLLVEMDGMTTRDDIIVLASTNRANVLDKALLRRGRFDRHILIDLPTQIERREIFEKHLASLSLQKPPAEYSDYLAALTPGFTGADIANVCNESALHAARLGKKKIYGSDLMYAIERARSGPSKSSNAMSATETKIVAYREAGYALLTWLLKHTDPVAKITIVPTTSGSLGQTQIIEAMSYTMPLTKIEDITCATLGSRITENLVFGFTTDATKHHLKKVTDLVYKQVAQYGMSPAVGLLSFNTDRFKREGKPFSKKLDNIIDIEVRRIIYESCNRAEAMLIKHRRLLNALAEELLKKETLYYEDVERLIGAPPYPKKRPQVPAAFMGSALAADESER